MFVVRLDVDRYESSMIVVSFTSPTLLRQTRFNAAVSDSSHGAAPGPITQWTVAVVLLELELEPDANEPPAKPIASNNTAPMRTQALRTLRGYAA